jgi:hypothetical protein
MLAISRRGKYKACEREKCSSCEALVKHHVGESTELVKHLVTIMYNFFLDRIPLKRVNPQIFNGITINSCRSSHSFEPLQGISPPKLWKVRISVIALLMPSLLLLKNLLFKNFNKRSPFSHLILMITNLWLGKQTMQFTSEIF